MNAEKLLIQTLEDLIKAVKNEHAPSIQEAVSDAINVLGYDPSEVDIEYLVALEIGVPAKNPEEAVQKFIELLKDNPTYEWCYRVTSDENDDVDEIVDTYRWENHEPPRRER